MRAMCGVLLIDRKISTDLMLMLGLKKTIGYGKLHVLVWSCVKDGELSCLEKGTRV